MLSYNHYSCKTFHQGVCRYRFPGLRAPQATVKKGAPLPHTGHHVKGLTPPDTTPTGGKTRAAHSDMGGSTGPWRIQGTCCRPHRQATEPCCGPGCSRQLFSPPLPPAFAAALALDVGCNLYQHRWHPTGQWVPGKEARAARVVLFICETGRHMVFPSADSLFNTHMASPKAGNFKSQPRSTPHGWQEAGNLNPCCCFPQQVH